MIAPDEWSKLNDEYTAADKEVRAAFAVVTRKFAAIAAGTSRENPTEEEHDRLDAARARRNEVELLMQEFSRRYFGT